MATKTETDLAQIEKMWARYKELAEGYQGFKLETLIVHLSPNESPAQKDEWRFLTGWLIALDAKASVPETRTMDYGSCIYDQAFLTEEQALNFLKAIATDRKATLSGHEIALPDHASFSDRGYTPVSYWEKVGPFAHYYFSIRLSDINLNFTEPIFGRDLPPYPDVRALSHEKFGSDIHTGGWNGEFLIFMPQYAARIKDVEFGRRRITATVEVTRPGKNGYRLGLWARKGVKHFHDEQPVRKSRVTFRLKEHPDQFMLFLTDGDSKNLIHHKGGKQDNVPAEDSLAKPSEWLKKIAEGEGQIVEFKHYPDSKDGSRRPYSKRIDTSTIAKELSAFSNSDGGTLFLGVDDVGEVHDVDDQKAIKALIANVVTTLCDPPLKPAITTIPMGDKKIIAISVQSGDRMRSIGGKVYIRRLATTRPASTAEIEELAQGKGSADDIFGAGPIVREMLRKRRRGR